MEVKEIIEGLKSCSRIKKYDEKKSIYKNIEYKHTDYVVGIICVNLLKSDSFQTYMYVRDKEDVASGLLGKTFSDVFDATNYFENLKFFAESLNLESLYNKVKNEK